MFLVDHFLESSFEEEWADWNAKHPPAGKAKMDP